MYDDNEVAISNRYLKEVITAIDDPIVVVGGWAVYFLVNDGYRETTGRDYIGSRDIDLGFSMSSADLENSALALALKKLEDELGFEHQAFRLFKEIHAETGEIVSSFYGSRYQLHAHPSDLARRARWRALRGANAGGEG